jgi:mono/diheme cytochrome c family protein
VLLVALAGAAALAAKTVFDRGLGARAEPWLVEEWVARRARHLATPRGERERRNPLPASTEVLAAGRAHFADHCAVCHANDGSGKTAFGAAMYPRAPDLRGSASQALRDGEIFSVIRNGVRFTGMPAFGSGPPEADQETWHLVHFIRSLPRITANELTEMEELNPKSRKELREDEEIRRFLAGETAPTPMPAAGNHGH